MILYGIGVGPGDPELITLKGKRLLESAGIVFVPSGRDDGSSYALEIAGAFIDVARQAIVPLPFPPVYDGAALDDVWAAHADTVATRLAGGLTGAFLLEGDPLFYGSFIHLRRALERRHPAVQVTIVPGIPSPIAAAALTGTVLAERNERIAILPGSANPADLHAALTSFDTVVILKISAGLDAVLDSLEQTGRGDDAVWVRRVGRPHQQIERDVRRLRGTRPDYFSLIIVRKKGT